MAGNKNIKINLDYSEFSSGIQDCQRKMGLLTEQFKMQKSALGNNATEVDKLRLSQSNLSDKIALQIQIVDKAAEKYKALANSEGATAAQVDKAQKSYMQQITKLNELTNELDNVNEKLEENAQAEQDAGDKADDYSGKNQSLMASITSTVAVISSLISACQQVAQALGELATKSTEWADDLLTTSAQIGITTTTLQELAYASSFVDVSVETMQGAMARLTKEMGNAQSGSASAQAAFSSLGVSITNADGSLKTSEQVFYEVIDALGGIQNTAERDAASMAIFGRSAQDLNTLIEAGSSSLQMYGEEARNLGIIMEESDVQALGRMQDSFDRLSSVMDAAQTRVSAGFAPALAGLADMISELDPTILAAASGFGSLLSIVSSLAPMLQAVAAITQMVTISKAAATGATLTETAAEVGLGEAALVTNAALMPQIAVAALLVAAIAALLYAIKSLIDAYVEYSAAADKAASSTQKFSDAASGVDTSDGTGTSSKKHYALGGRAGGRVWVGEQGAELVDLPSGSTVYNHQESSNMTSSSNVFNITIDAKSVDEFNKVVNVFSGLSQSMNRGGKVNG